MVYFRKFVLWIDILIIEEENLVEWKNFNSC